MRAAIGSRVTRRHPAEPPKVWLMTDERMGDRLWRALRRLPRGSGVVFRHYATPPVERRRLYRRIAAVARARGLVLVRAGEEALGVEAGTHGRRGGGLTTWAAHDRAEALRGMRAGADLLFVSPVFATRSHAGATALGLIRARRIVAGLPARAVALGGMTPARGKALMRAGWWGWAAIDAWLD
jgi:thiamine-phosphate pyrophosphorylase